MMPDPDWRIALILDLLGEGSHALGRTILSRHYIANLISA